MSWTFAACALIAMAWLGLFYLWGRAFLTWIGAKPDVAGSTAFGYLVLQLLYQMIYLPFYFTRGSYRAVSYIWLAVTVLLSFFLLFRLRRYAPARKISLNRAEKAGVCAAIVLILGLASFIALHVPFYGRDTGFYITYMNDFYYDDAMYVNAGVLNLHYGMSSMFCLFTVPSLLTGIKPYYISLFTVRIVGVCLSSLVLYRMGKTVFQKGEDSFSWPALCLSVLVPVFLMNWGSSYTAEFYYWRINEAKGYCQFMLLPLSVSVFLAMFRKDADRKRLWKEQLMIGLAAVPVSASSLTAYLFLLLMGTLALLAFDKLKNGGRTVGHAFLCALPNLLYLAVYSLEVKSFIVF